jgi:hypothetical protein
MKKDKKYFHSIRKKTFPTSISKKKIMVGKKLRECILREQIEKMSNKKIK